MRLSKRTALAGVMLAVATAGAQRLQRWTGVATVNGQPIPIEVQISAPSRDGHVTGGFVNGSEVERASGGTEANGHVVLQFSDYARALEGDIAGNSFHGVFKGARVKVPVPVELQMEPNPRPATRFAAGTDKSAGGSTISGEWEIAVNSSKGEAAWTMRVVPYRGNGEIRAVVQRVDGDTGSLYGGFDPAKGEYRVSRFGAFGRDYYALKPQADGTLVFTDLLRPSDTPHTARRTTEARAAKLPPPTVPTEATSMENPAEPLRFSAPNLAGVPISSGDAQFKGKVVIVAVGGSWCVNCHDEAPFLVDLYNRFHAQGLEIVDLSFEEDDQLKDPRRLREFVTEYHIPYTVLVAGTPDDVHKVLPQAKRLDSWPTTFFVGRNGLVEEVHAGYSGPATGEAHVKLKADITALVEKLLAQKDVAQR